jgi:ATP-binding cassette subfamily B protein
MAVDVVVKKEESWLASMGITDLFDQLIAVSVLTVLIWGLESVFEYLLKWYWRNLAQTIQHEMRLDTYSHVQNLDMAWFQERSTGRLLSIMNDDINQLERFLDGGANDLLQVGTSVIAISAVFFWLSPVVALFALMPIPLIIWGSFRFQSRIAPRYLSVREHASLMNDQLSNNLSGIETIKSFTAESMEVDRLTALSQNYKESNRHAIALSSAFSPLIRMVIVIGFTATLLYGGMLTLEGQIEVGAYSVLVFMTQRLLWPLTRLGETFDLFQRAMASTTRVLNLLNTSINIKDGETPLPIHSVNGSLSFRDVEFSYPDHPILLEKFSLDIATGQTVAIVGPTGAGKSTLVRLLLRFYTPTKGTILLDDKPLSILKLEDLRGAIGLVSQTVFLFSGTVFDNIAYGLQGASRQQVIKAAKQAEVHDFIMTLPDGYDTMIGERGQKLSGGQRQRVSIARAILKNPPILILDEATSSVDNETEAAIQRSLKRLRGECTMVVIAHRLSTIRDSDLIVVMERGKVVERGTHESLIEEHGLYANLWKIQTGKQNDH